MPTMGSSKWRSAAGKMCPKKLGSATVCDKGWEKPMFNSKPICWVIVWAVAATQTAAPGQAKPISSTQYAYYTVSGTNAAALHQSMVVRGPSVYGDKAYATTEVAGSLGGSLVAGPNGCQLQNYRMKLDFTMRLPRMESGLALKSELRERWRSFERFVRAHEAVHRSIWLSCASAVEKKVRAIRARNCQAAQALATKILHKLWSACAQRHDAFDAAQRHPLMREPFILSANTTFQMMTSDGLRIRGAKAGRSRRRLGM
jgi:predicted secreted Zn-dependent protease